MAVTLFYFFVGGNKRGVDPKKRICSKGIK